MRGNPKTALLLSALPMLRMIVAHLRTAHASACILAVACMVIGTSCCSLPSRNEQLVAAREQTRQALYAVDRGNLEEARVRLEHALKAAPDDCRARRHYAKLLWQIGDHEQAIEQLDAAARCGGDPLWTVELGEMLLAEDVVAGAIECAEAALERNRNLSSAWILRGDALRAQLHNDAARKSYFRALSCEACDPRALLELAEIYRVEGRPRRALSSLQRLEADYPASRHPRQLAYLQGVALQALGQHDTAVEKFNLAREQLGDQSELLLLLAESQFQLGRTEDARQALELAAADLPGDQRVADLTRRLHAAGNRLANTY